jgi:vancomycin resistance protein YoaR
VGWFLFKIQGAFLLNFIVNIVKLSARMKNRIITTIFLLLVSFLIHPNPLLAEGKVGFFFNDNLQEMINDAYVLKVEDEEYSVSIGQFVSTQTILVRSDGHQAEVENIRYCRESLLTLSICDLTNTVVSNQGMRKGAAMFVLEESIRKHLESIASEIGIEPVDGRFRMTEDGKLKIVKVSRKGYELDVDASASQIMNGIKNNPTETEIPLIAKEIEPKISSEDLNSLGIAERIGHGESSFWGSPNNRVFNISLATSKFEGVVISPGEEFSFVSILGSVDEESGYKEELVIKKNETIPEFGGGVCQVSTTMFRAALDAGFLITERRNHAYPVAYYSPQGTDATIYLPKPDFRFINDTDSHILIQPEIVGKKLLIDVYGSSGGRVVEIEGPRVTERTEEGTMRTVLYQIVRDQNGNEIRKVAFKSFYDNPDNYHPPEFTEKPDSWSKSEWREYKKKHGL